MDWKQRGESGGVRSENINGVSGSGAALKSSTSTPPPSHPPTWGWNKTRSCGREFREWLATPPQEAGLVRRENTRGRINSRSCMFVSASRPFSLHVVYQRQLVCLAHVSSGRGFAWSAVGSCRYVGASCPLVTSSSHLSTVLFAIMQLNRWKTALWLQKM